MDYNIGARLALHTKSPQRTIVAGMQTDPTVYISRIHQPTTRQELRGVMSELGTMAGDTCKVLLVTQTLCDLNWPLWDTIRALERYRGEANLADDVRQELLDILYTVESKIDWLLADED